MSNYGKAIGGLIGLGVTLAVTDSVLRRSGLIKRVRRKKRRNDYYYNYFW